MPARSLSKSFPAKPYSAFAGYYARAKASFSFLLRQKGTERKIFTPPSSLACSSSSRYESAIRIPCGGHVRILHFARARACVVSPCYIRSLYATFPRGCCCCCYNTHPCIRACARPRTYNGPLKRLRAPKCRTM